MRTASWAVIAIALVACGKSDGKSGNTDGTGNKGTGAGATAPVAGKRAPDPVVTGPQDRCDLKVSGDLDLDLHWTHPRGGRPSGKLMAATDYWMTDADIRSAIGMMAGIGSKLSKEEQAQKVDDAMKRDPKFMLLMLNCSGEEGTIILGPGKSHYADVPYAAKKYPVTDGTSTLGEFGGMVGFRPGGKHESYRIAEPGVLDITKFDATGIAGSFHFKAKRSFGTPDKHIEVTGTFDYACYGGTSCKK